jgi:hypothetical protein
MITIRISADVKDDHRVVLTLTPEVPTGKNEFIVSIAQESDLVEGVSRSSLADWSERRAEHWGEKLNSANVEGFTGRGT